MIILIIIALAILSIGFALYQGIQAWKSRKALERVLEIAEMTSRDRLKE